MDSYWTWMYTPAPVDSYGIISNNDGDLLAATLSGIYSSSNGGKNWRYDNASHDLGLSLLSIGVDGNNTIFLGMLYYGSLYKKNVIDTAWIWLGSTGGKTAIRRIECAVNGSMYIATIPDRMLGYCGSGLWKSRDSGKTLVNISNGLRFRNNAQGTPDSSVFEIVRLSSGRLVTGTSEGIYYSEDDGDSWIRSQGIAQKTKVMTLSNSSDEIIYAAGEGVFKSIDGGVSWKEISAAITGEDIVSNARGFVCAGNSDGRIFFSADGGSSWTENDIQIAYPNTYPTCTLLLDRSNYLWVSIPGAGGILRSTKAIP